MSDLYAALDGFGALKMVGDVPRGAACACFCPVCGAPLVAKQGTEKVWHFAHEASQEKPECKTGAINMLRRLAIEHLTQKQDWALPPILRTVYSSTGFNRLQGTIEVNDTLVGDWQWLPPKSASDPIATSHLETGARVDLYVVVEGEGLQLGPDKAAAALVFQVLVPPLQYRRTLAAAETYLKGTSTMRWVLHPGAEAATLRKQRELDAAYRAQQEQFHAAQAAQAGKRWAKVAHRLERAGEEQEDDAPAPSTSPPPPAPPPPAPDHPYSWAPGRKPGTSFNFYRLKDGSAWVFFRRYDGTMGLAPWGEASEGWDEYFPPGVGTADPELGIYIVSNWPKAFEYLGARSHVTRNGDNPDLFNGL